MYYLKASEIKYNDSCLPPVLPQQGNQNRWFAKTFDNPKSFSQYIMPDVILLTLNVSGVMHQNSWQPQNLTKLKMKIEESRVLKCKPREKLGNLKTRASVDVVGEDKLLVTGWATCFLRSIWQGVEQEVHTSTESGLGLGFLLQASSHVKD